MEPRCPQLALGQTQNHGGETTGRLQDEEHAVPFRGSLLSGMWGQNVSLTGVIEIGQGNRVRHITDDYLATIKVMNTGAREALVQIKARSQVSHYVPFVL